MNKNIIKILFILILGYLLIKHSSKLTRLINTIFGGAVKGIETIQGEEFDNYE